MAVDLKQWMYELKEAISYLDEPESKTKWTRTVKEAVYKSG
jgi:hypothetical protein